MTEVVASAELVAVRRGERTRCEVVRSAPPLTFRVTGTTVHVVGTAGGPVGGDRLRMRIVVGRGATLDVRSVAATVVLPGPRGAPSSVEVEMEVDVGATLLWAPQPLVVADGADHRVRCAVRLAPGAALHLVDTLVLGRSGETGGSVVQRLDVEVGGAPRLRSEVWLGPCWEDEGGPATTGGARALGQVLVVDPGASPLGAVGVPFVDGVRGGVMELPGGGMLASVLGVDAASVGRAVATVREVVTGRSCVGAHRGMDVRPVDPTG